MTGPEHYQAAEDLLDEPLGENPEHAWRFIMQAQVHATLALAAATALHDPEGGTVGDEHGAWLKAASDYYGKPQAVTS